MAGLKIDIYSHNFAVTKFDQRGKEALFSFCKKSLVQWSWNRVDGRMVRELIRTYAASNQERSVFRFHINCYNDFIIHLENFGLSSRSFQIVKHPLYKPAVVKYNLIFKHPPFDYQVRGVDYVVADGKSKLVTLQTGFGKGGLSLRSFVPLATRVACVIKGMYVEKWIQEYIDYFGKVKGDIIVVRGSKDLKNIIELGLAGEIEAKFIIITNTTLYNFYYEFERFNGADSYGCDPIDLWKVLGVGLRLIDELHQDFHLNFRLDLYSHVPKVLSMSATMEADDPFICKMYELAYPLDSRFEKLPFDKYISVKALTYTLNDPKRLKWQNWIRRSYSHVIYEQSLIKNPPILKNYLELIKLIVENSFIRKRKPGQKMIIFAATVEMCTIITKYLRDIYTTVGIVRYTSDDEYEDLLAADISVSTLKSAGTALDIPGLMITLLTDNVNSRQANDQVLGRTRKMKGEWADITPEFLYLVCNSIPKHLEYHQKKMSIFADKVLSHQTMETGIRV